MFISASQLSAVKSMNGTGLYTPALLTRTSMRPNCWSTAGTSSAQSSTEPTSDRIPSTSPGPPSLLAAELTSSAFLAQTATAYPSASSRSAQA